MGGYGFYGDRLAQVLVVVGIRGFGVRPSKGDVDGLQLGSVVTGMFWWLVGG